MNLLETLNKKAVIRKGMKKIKYTTDREGYKVKIDPRTGAAREEKMSQKEIRNRMIAARKAKQKRAGKQGQMNRKRKMSMQKRKNW